MPHSTFKYYTLERVEDSMEIAIDNTKHLDKAGNYMTPPSITSSKVQTGTLYNLSRLF